MNTYYKRVLPSPSILFHVSPVNFHEYLSATQLIYIGFSCPKLDQVEVNIITLHALATESSTHAKMSTTEDWLFCCENRE